MHFLNKKFALWAFVLIVIVGAIVFLRETIILEGIQPELLKQYILNYGAYAPIAYIVIYTLGTVFFIPGTLITLAGGAVFGPLDGTIYTVVGATAGAVAAFLITRMTNLSLGKAQKNGVLERLKTYDHMIAERGLETVLFLRLVPLFPFNALNFALGFTSISFKHYFWGTFIGIIPGTFVYVYFGNALGTLMLKEIIIASVLMIGLTILGWYLKKYMHRNTSV